METEIVTRCESFNCGTDLEGLDGYEYMGQCRICGL